MVDWFEKEILIFGCGNILFGDDGFGVEVVKSLKENYKIPENAVIIEAGTSIRGILFDIILHEKKPKKVVIVDAVDVGRKGGEVFEISLDELPENKIDDFSFHQLPTSNLLKDLRDLCQVEVILVSAQVESIPEMVKPGLSKALINAIPEACELILKKIKGI